MAVDTVVLTIGLLSAFIVVVALAAQIRYSRYSKRVLKRQQRLKRADKLLDALAGTLRATANPDAAPATSLEPETDTLMLVFTDIESSTTAAAESPRAMVLVQETHDRLMRQGIQRFAGYEIHTQGDAFEIAFATAVSATQFCLWVQDQLMNYDWPKEVLYVPQFAAVKDEDTEDVIFRGPRVRMGVHAAPPGTWRKGTHGYTHHTVFGGEGVDLIAAVSDAGHGGQVVLTKDAADALIPRIHKVDALLESIGTFRVRADDDDADGVSLELFDCQPLPTPKRPRRVFSKHLRRIEYVAPGRSLAVIPPPPALRRDSADEAFIVVVVAEEGTGDDPELAGALKAVLAQQAQLAGGYLASPDACAEGGAVVIFRTDYGAAARFLAVLPVVLAWWEWPEGARKHVVVEGTAPVPTVRVKVAMHVSSDVFEETLSAEALAAKRAEQLARARAPEKRGGKNGIERAGSVLRRGGKLMIDAVELTGREAARLPARMLGKQDSDRGGLRLGSSGRDAQGTTLDDLSEFTEMTEVHGSGVDRARAVAAAAHPGQCIMTLSAFTNVQSAARMPAGAFPVSLGRHAITQEDLEMACLWAYEESVSSGDKTSTERRSDGSLISRGWDINSHGEELYELVSTFLGMQSSTPRLKTAKALTPGYRQSPDPNKPVAVCFVSLSAPDRESETTKRALETASAVLRKSLAAHRGYECKQPEPNKFTLAFGDFDDAVSFTGDVHVKLLNADWEEELLKKKGCEPRVDPETGFVVWRGLHARCGVAFGVGSTRKPLNTGRADYFGAIPNLAARVCAVARYGQTLIEPTSELKRVRWPEKSFDEREEPLFGSAAIGNETSHASPWVKHRSLLVTELARSPENNRRASMDYSGVGGALREDASCSVWSTLEENERDAYSLVSGCVAGAFEPKMWVDGECVAWDDANAGEVSQKTGSAMTIDLLGQFDLRGVSRRATLAQALPASLRAARSKTFEPPEGLAVAARDAAVGAVSIASRDAHLHYDKKGLGKSTARGFARSRSMTKSGSDRGRSSGALGAVLRLLSPVLSPILERGGARRSLRTPRAAKPRSVHSVTVAADAALDAAESGRAASSPRGDLPSSADSGETPAAPDASKARLTAGLRGLDKFRKAGKLIVVSNRFEGAMRARLKRNGQDDWGFAGDLENMPTAESERLAEDAAAARIGEEGKDGDSRLSNETLEEDGERRLELSAEVPSREEKPPEAATGARASHAATEPAA